MAHTVFTDFYVNKQPQGDGVAVRMRLDRDHVSSPIAGLKSDNMACNVDGTTGVSRVQSVPDGALLTFEFRQWSTDPTRGALPDNHKGPCAVYLKKVDSAIKDRGAGDGWFKIFANGHDLNTNRWCTDELIANKGLLSVQLPQGLEGGSYLARPEILALHASTVGDPQFYTGCAQIFLQSTGNLVPESTVSIPGYVDYNQPATNFDVWNKMKLQYTLPGPPIAKLKAGTQKLSNLNQTEGLRPAGCIMENGQWCGYEVPSYTDEKGCWASHEDCWAQSRDCYAKATPSGHIGCKLWENKCTDIRAQCKAKNFNGPPNKGKDLTPAKKPIDVGKILPQAQFTTGDSKSSSPAPEQDAPYASASSSASASPSASPSTTPAYDAKPAGDAKPAYDSDAKPDAYAKPSISSSISSSTPLPTLVPQTCPEGCKASVSVTTVTVTASATCTPRSAVYHRRHARHA